MEQYNTTEQTVSIPKLKDTTDQSQVQQLQKTISTLETFVHSQGKDILKMRRDISRLKADIDTLSSHLSKRG